MNDLDDDDCPATYASPPCFMHELDPAYAGLGAAPDPHRHADVMRWRKARRKRLIEERLAVPGRLRRRHSGQIASALNAAIGSVDGLIVSAYWPFRGEPDLRDFMERVYLCGGRCALPVVVERAKPLIFRSWVPGEPLDAGVWNIPIPAEGREVVPDVVIAPVVGFDGAGYRLGYGGGYYDRTLAALSARPRVIGVGYSQAFIATIYPQPHDIAMDMVLTETGVAVGPT